MYVLNKQVSTFQSLFFGFVFWFEELPLTESLWDGYGNIKTSPGSIKISKKQTHTSADQNAIVV